MQGYTNEAEANRAIRVTLDPVPLKCKLKTGREFEDITRRMQRAGSTEITVSDFCDALQRGCTFAGGTYKPCSSGWGEYQGMQIFAVDFDNKAPAKDENGKPIKGKFVTLKPGDEGFLDPMDALERCSTLGLSPLCLYFTMSSRCPDIVRYRIVIDVERLVDEESAQKIIDGLLKVFPEADQSCSWPHHLYFGSNGELWECWRTWGGAE